MGLLILDIQHSGKPSRPSERGASADVDGDGKTAVWETEAALTPIYASEATVQATKLGHSCVVLASGTYAERHVKSNQLAREYPGKVLYVACHLNAGGGDYGLVLHDSRSVQGRRAAGAIVASMRTFWTPRSVRPLDPQATAKDHPQWPRPFVTIEGIWSGPSNIAAICFEPLFVDTHRTWLTHPNLRMVGKQLALGFHAWATS